MRGQEISRAASRRWVAIGLIAGCVGVGLGQAEESGAQQGLTPGVQRERIAEGLRRAADRIEAGESVSVVLREETDWSGTRSGLQFGPSSASVQERIAERARGRFGDRSGPRDEGRRGRGPGADGGGFGRPGWSGEGPGRSVSEEERLEARRAIVARVPEFAAWLGIGIDGSVLEDGAEGMDEVGPGIERSRIRQHVERRVAGILRTAETRPEAAEIEFGEIAGRFRMMRAVRAFREAQAVGEESAMGAARIEIRSALETLFEVRLRGQRLEIERLSDRLAQLRRETERLQAAQEEYVERKMREFEGRLGGRD